jgi:DNA-binding beta-propeller fold protein YncE
MAAMTNILVKDDSNPLVEFTLVPIANNRPKWRAQVTGVPVEAQITLELIANTRLADGSWRRVLKIEVPELETLGTAGTSAGYVAPQKVAFVTPITVTTIMNARATTASMANSFKLLLGLLAGATSTTAAGTMNGASVADTYKNSTAQVPRFFVYGEDPF